MRGAILYILFLFVFLLSFLFAEGKDSVLTTFPEVKVEAEGYKLMNEKKFSAYSEIDLSSIEQENPRQISEILNKEPGIYIKDYGGYGGIKTISMRGTSSLQTLILIEGMRFNSVQNGSTDFSLLPVSMLQSVDILRGGTSAIFGGSSIGGTINFNLKTEDRDLKIKAGIGSFMEYSASLSAGIDLAGTSVGLSADYINAKGNYPFIVKQFDETKEYKRENADFENLNIMLHSSIKNDYWKYKIIAMARFSERGSPGPVLLGYIEPQDARLNEKEGDFIFKAEREIRENYFSAGLMYRYNYQRYFDSHSPDAMSGDSVSLFNTNALQYNMRYTDNYDIVKIIYGVDGEYTNLTGDFLQPETGNNVSRFQSGFYVQAVSNIVNTSAINLPLQLAARYDYYTDISGSPTGVAGLSLQMKKINLAMKTQIAYNYRAPSFNEMYYLNYGTTDLKPERSTSLNLTLAYERKFINLSVNGYLIDTKDQIVAVPKSPLTWSAQNMASVFSRGIEFVFDVPIFDDNLSIGGSYTIQSVINNNKNSDTYGNQVVYVPQEMLTAKIDAKLKGFYADFNTQYSGFTYYLPENVFSSVIPAYWLLNLNLSKKFDIGYSDLTIKFDIINLLDEQYVVIKNYPMPGRIFRLGIEFKVR